MSLFRQFSNSARRTSRATMETANAKVITVYADPQGINILSADVLIDGQVTVLRRVPNASGLRLGTGARVKVNYSKGNRLSYQVIGASSTSTGNLAVDEISAIAGLADSVTNGLQALGDSLQTGHPFLLFAPDTQLDGAAVLVAGANIQLTDIPDGAINSSDFQEDDFQVSMIPLILPYLPGQGQVYNGTLLDLIDSYGNVLMLYRWDSSAGVWRQRIPYATNSLPGLIQLAKDIGGTYLYPIVEGILGLKVNALPTVDGQVLTYVGANNDLEWKAPGGNVVDGEQASGVIDGSNAVFTWANAPSPASSLRLFFDGARQFSTDSQFGFSTVGNTTTFINPPPATIGGIFGDYRY